MQLLNSVIDSKRKVDVAPDISIAKIIDSLPGNVYWFDRYEIFLGCNKRQAEVFGANPQEVIGRHIGEFCTSESYEEIHAVNEKIFSTGEAFKGEESITFHTGTEKLTFFSQKIPLKDDAGNVIAILGISFDLRDVLLNYDEEISLFNTIIHALPVNVYWRDTKGLYLGCNEHQAKLLGLGSRFDIIGKTSAEVIEALEPGNPNNKSNCEAIDTIDFDVMNRGILRKVEESLISKAGKATRVFHSQKLPLRDRAGEIKGLVGISIDISAEKEAERLKQEALLVELRAQEKFSKLAQQVAHDIASPTLALSMLVESCEDIPEEVRLLLRHTAGRINDIARSLLSHYKNKDVAESHNELSTELLISASILPILAEKRLEYSNHGISLGYISSTFSNLAFIQVQPSAFRRMLSNIINNAADSFDESLREKTVLIRLEAEHERVKIIIEDTGRGMSPELINKIMKNISVTEGKKEGHGIGLTQVHEVLECNQGELSIESTLGRGSKFILTFPRIKAPSWMAEEIRFKPKDIVVILDDDHSIHKAWNTHFEPVIIQRLQIEVKHFSAGIDALNFINSLPTSDKSKVFLLADYELVGQGLNGLEVVAQSGIERSVLVTGHFAVESVQERTVRVGAKILPKHLASQIPIVVV